jgi:hypothetical protein
MGNLNAACLTKLNKERRWQDSLTFLFNSFLQFKPILKEVFLNAKFCNY